MAVVCASVVDDAYEDTEAGFLAEYRIEAVLKVGRGVVDGNDDVEVVIGMDGIGAHAAAALVAM